MATANSNERQEPAPATDLRPLLVVLTGPSGAGKDTVLDWVVALLRDAGRPAERIATWTTRELRAGEVEGVHYRRIESRERFEELDAAGAFIERNEFSGNSHYYGSPREPVRDTLARGSDAILRVDVNGAAAIQAAVPGAVTIFIAVPDMETLRSRMRERALAEGRPMPPEELDRRVRTAEQELPRAVECHHVVMNDGPTAEKAAREVMAILARERARPDRVAADV
jgi:guanylate kinase